MTIFGILVLWATYATALWGYCLLRGYDVTPGNIVDWNYPASLVKS